METDVLRQMLATLKSTKGAELAELARAIPDHYRYTDYSSEHLVREPLLTLIRWGFVEVYDGRDLVPVETVDDIYRSSRLKFYLSRHAVEIEEAFGVRLDAAPSAIFGKPRRPIGRWPEVFVLMPFAPELKPVYDDHIVKVVTRKGLTIARADDFFSTGSVMADVWSALNAASFLIADCTGRNPNVFYETGLAHAIGKPTILMSRVIDDVPFDLRHLRVVIYEYTPRGMSLFERALGKSIDSLSARRAGTPANQALQPTSRARGVGTNSRKRSRTTRG